MIFRIRGTSGHTILEVAFPEPLKSGWNLRDVFTSEKVSSRKGLSAPNAKMITFNGVTDTMKGWAHRIGLPYTALAYRLGTGWSIEKALTTESKKRV